MRVKFYALLALVLVLSLCAAGCGTTKTKRTVTLTGKIEVPPLAITAPREGKILGLILEKGDRIRKGEPLFAITQKGEDAGIEKATADLARAEAELKNAKSGASAAQVKKLPAPTMATSSPTGMSGFGRLPQPASSNPAPAACRKRRRE